ncbi:uncharacterized protein LOC122999389 isoform X4 [Thunnus albacares]|uniref:uncharacterized protein LOC122999389 isoform X4 n=1 Tax=Thunnus albacares TaxID=8236 RepID=UPI001CF6DF8C|nr:uncharacterized protein LOC122999389 isoform X4 [Thunnus albacares]
MSRMISLSGKAGNCLHLLHQTSLLRCMQPSSSGRCSFLPFAFCPSSPKFESLAEAMYRFHFPAHFDQAAYYSDAEGSAGMSFTGITCLSRRAGYDGMKKRMSFRPNRTTLQAEIRTPIFSGAMWTIWPPTEPHIYPTVTYICALRIHYSQSAEMH